MLFKTFPSFKALFPSILANTFIKVLQLISKLISFFSFINFSYTSRSGKFEINLSGACVANDLKASIMGRYPVHRHIFPSREVSTSLGVTLPIPFSVARLRELQKNCYMKNVKVVKLHGM